ncbi:MAG: hypothetical protein HY083_00385 [Gammaproteobacteria bacterium]|nr:hypothetical protein [Gammaproteobacteria bacterium]
MMRIMAFRQLAGKTFAALIFFLAGSLTAHAAAPVLLTLESADPGKPRVSVTIKAEGGLTASPTRGQTREKWTLRPGEALTSDVRPADRLVELYQASGTQATLLCAVQVRYFQNRDGQWQPHYVMIDEPLVMRQGERWLPGTALRGNAALVVLTSVTLPNAEGFYPTLEFGLSIGTTPIDYWQVK